jgi:ABC-type uncharacterized transport system permease subunit
VLIDASRLRSALRIGLAPTDLKLVTAALLLASLAVPRLRRAR